MNPADHLPICDGILEDLLKHPMERKIFDCRPIPLLCDFMEVAQAHPDLTIEIDLNGSTILNTDRLICRWGSHTVYAGYRLDWGPMVIFSQDDTKPYKEHHGQGQHGDIRALAEMFAQSIKKHGSDIASDPPCHTAEPGTFTALVWASFLRLDVKVLEAEIARLDPPVESDHDEPTLTRTDIEDIFGIYNDEIPF